jgi:hypothetical protein
MEAWVLFLLCAGPGAFCMPQGPSQNQSILAGNDCVDHITTVPGERNSGDPGSNPVEVLRS